MGKFYHRFITTLFLIFLLFTSHESRANLSNYTFSQSIDTNGILTNATTLYTTNFDHTIIFGDPLYLGLVNPSNLIFSGIPIGFNFVFDGDTQNVFGVTSRGYMVLGKNSVNMNLFPNTNPISNTNTGSNIISALGGYLNPSETGVIKFKSSGTAPNRILTVQWMNMRRPNYQGLDSIYFQIRLHETTNAIDLVYNKMIVSTKIPDSFFEVGLRGKLTNNFYNRRQVSGWSNTLQGFSKFNTCRLGKHIFSEEGRVFTFTPPVQNCSTSNYIPLIKAYNYSTCSNQYVALVVDSISPGKSTTFLWQSSTDSVNWTAITGAIYSYLSVPQTASTFYRCVMTCATSIVTTSAVKIVQFGTNQCYCNSASRYPDDINIGKVQVATLSNGNAGTSVDSSNFSSYTDYGNLGATNLSKGSSYFISVSEIFKTAYIKSSVAVFIDFNQDGVFDDSTEQFAIGKTKTYADGYHAKGFIQIPTGALSGITKMRVMLYDPNSALPFTACSAAFYGETEDYLVNINTAPACNLVPDTVYAVASVTKVCSGVQFKLFIATQLLENYSYQWYQSSDSLSWTAISGADKNFLFTTQNSTNFYKCLVKCGTADSVFTNPVKVIRSEFYYCYCSSKANNPSDVQITNVQLYNLNNSSTGTTKLYSNFTNLLPDTLVAGGKYLLSINQKRSGSLQIKAFIDFDRNGVFGNTNNETFLIDSAHAIVPSSATLFSSLINVSASVDTGITGLRIIINENTVSSSCGITNHGETEDYLVRIVPADTCKFPINAGQTVASDTSLCDGEVAHLSIRGTSYSPAYTYQWQTSADSLNWLDVANSNQFSINRIQTGKTYYRCKISCSGNEAYSIPVAIPRRYILLCYCNSSAGWPDYYDIGNIKIAGYDYGIDTLAVNPAATNKYSSFLDSLAPVIVERGGNYPLTIQLAKTQSNNSTIYVSAFFDFNRNGIFEATETFNAPVFSSGVTLKTTVLIPVPASAVLGLTRLRIVLKDAYLTSYPSACVGYPYGETEDYALDIIEALPCQLISPTSITSDKNNLCLGEIYKLKSVGAAFQAHLKYTWQKSLDNANWNTLLIGYYDSYSDTMKAETFYRCIVSCDSTSDTSSVFKIIKKSNLDCYCTSYAYSSSYSDIGNIKIAGYNYGQDTLVTNPFATNTYSDFSSTLPPIVLQKNGSYPMKITHAKTIVNSINNYAVASVSIDFNQNEIFDLNERFSTGYFSYTNPAIGTTQVIVPDSIPSGITKMRVVLTNNSNYYPGPPSCGLYYNYGETEDYAVDIINTLPCLALSHGTLSSDKNEMCKNEVCQLSYSGNPQQIALTFTLQKSTDSLTWQTVSTLYTPGWQQTFIGKCFYRCIATCGSQSDTTDVIVLKQKAISQCYCISTATASNYLDIGNIKMAGVSYGADTVFNANYVNQNYSDFTTSLAAIPVEVGGTYPLVISPANFSTNLIGASCHISVAIDFNGDGVFDNPEISYSYSSVTGGNNLFSFMIHIPLQAQTGISRMRIVLSSYGQPYACGTYYSGETEDYAVTILPQSNCVPLNQGFLYSADDSVCTNSSQILFYSGNLYQAKFNYRWESSADSLTWSLVGNLAIPQFIVANLSQSTYYRVIVSCDTYQDTSKLIRIVKRPNQECYCVSASTDTVLFDIGNIQLAGYSYGSDTLLVNSTANQVYSDFTNSLPPIKLQKGGFYPITITKANRIDNALYSSATVYCDFSQDAIFGSNSDEKFDAGSFIDLKAKADIFVPANAPKGITRLRIIQSGNSSYWNAPCGIYVQSGETEDYAIDVIDSLPCDSLKHGYLTSVKSKYCYGNYFTLNYVGNESQPYLYYIWQSSADSLNWINVNANGRHSDYSSNLYSRKYFRCIATCGSFRDTSEAIVLEMEYLFYHCYCASTFITAANQDIGKVTLLTLNNGNPLPFLNNINARNKYSDFTSLPPVDITKGFVYPLSVTQTNRSDFHRSKVMAYLDFNRNGSFEKGVEEFFIGFTNDSVVPLGLVQGNIAVPYNAQAGLTGMRIILGEKTPTNTIFACGSNNNWGETEDYLVNIVNNTQCLQPVAGNTVTPIDMICYGDSAYIYLQGNSNRNGESYQWQWSTNGSGWYNAGIPSAFPELRFEITGTLYFRCKVFCDSLFDYSSILQIKLLNGPNVCNTCNYLGGSECFWNDKIINVSIIGTPLNNSDSSCYEINGSWYYLFPPTSNRTAVLARGSSYPLVVTTSKKGNISVWIDYNRNGVFAGNEWKKVCDSCVAGMPNVVMLDVPITAGLGQTKMRIRNRYDTNQNGPNDACTYFYSGETEDYVLTIDVANTVHEIQSNNEFMILSNPAKDNLEFYYLTSKAMDAEIKIYDSRGGLVFTKTMVCKQSTTKNSIDVSDYARGIYFLEFKNQDKIFHKKIILN